MSQQGSVQQSEGGFDPEKQYLEKAYRPKPKIRDEQDIKYIQKQRLLQKKMQKGEVEDEANQTQIANPQEFEPTKELIQQKEKIKREKLFAKQAVTIVRVSLQKGVYYYEPEENQLKWNYKQYEKYGKKKGVESKHMKMAGISFKKKKKQDGDQTQNQEDKQSQQGGGGEDQEQNQNQNQNQTQEQDDAGIRDEKIDVYAELKYGKAFYKSESNMGQNTEDKKGNLNPFEFLTEWNEDFEFDKVTDTIVYFNIRQKDTDSDYKQRHSWLKKKYEGDLIIGKAKLDLAQLVISKDKDEKRDKEIPIKNEQNEKIGLLSVGIQYVKPIYEKIDRKRLDFNYQIDDLKADFSKADLTKLKEKFEGIDVEGSQDLVPYAKVRIGQQVRKTQPGTGTSVSGDEPYKFDVPDDIMKLYVEVHLFNEVFKFNECCGIAMYHFSNLKKKPEDDPMEPIIDDVKLPLSYKGKVGGEVTFKITKFLQKPEKERKFFEGIDVKKISQPNEFDLKRKQILDLKKDQLTQKYHHMNHKQIEDEKIKQFLTPQNYRKADIKKIDRPAVKLPYLKSNQSSTLISNPFLLNQSMMQQQGGPLQGEDTVNSQIFGDFPDKKIRKDPINIKMVNDPKYFNQIRGQGFSKWESSATLQRSVPHFSVPRSQRFGGYDTNVPGPNKYSKIGILEDMEKIDRKLQMKRERDFQEYQKYKKENP